MAEGGGAVKEQCQALPHLRNFKELTHLGNVQVYKVEWIYIYIYIYIYTHRFYIAVIYVRVATTFYYTYKYYVMSYSGSILCR